MAFICPPLVQVTESWRLELVVKIWKAEWRRERDLFAVSQDFRSHVLQAANVSAYHQGSAVTTGVQESWSGIRSARSVLVLADAPLAMYQDHSVYIIQVHRLQW
jgi:hypothetical protein